MDKSKKKVSQDENKSITELDVASLESKVTQVSVLYMYVYSMSIPYVCTVQNLKDKYDK